jgi:hypothetical protein
MNWTEEEPGLGEPSGIRHLAAIRRTKADSIRSAITSIVGAQTQAESPDWVSESRDSFVTALDASLVDLKLLVTGLDAQADALTAYATAVQSIHDLADAVTHKIKTSTELVGEYKLHLAELRGQTFATVGSDGGYYSPFLDADEKTQRTVQVQHLLEDETVSLAGAERQLSELAVQRRQADAVCVAALLSPSTLGPLAGFTAATIKADTPAQLLALLGTLSPTDAQILLAEHPELAAKVQKADPNKVSAWWASLSPIEQAGLIAGAPTIIGFLDGLPPLARVAANKLNAEAQIAKDKRKLAIDQEVDGLANSTAYSDEITNLKKEIKYLEGAVGENPTVQLYLYDPEKSRIIQMIGTPGPQTTHTITYVPGTFTNLDSFYGKSAQEISQWMVTHHADTVAFVYKDGLFPGESDPGGGMNLARIGEANDQGRAIAAGQQLSSFQRGLDADPTMRATESTAIGHSWGLTDVTSSEVAGAHYDQVISLSGAGMPKGWHASPTTTYNDYSYPDILQVAQQTGTVWNGDVPRADAAFQEGAYYKGADPVVSNPLHIPFADYNNLMSNHNLVSTSSGANRKVLYDVASEIYQ